MKGGVNNSFFSKPFRRAAPNNRMQWSAASEIHMVTLSVPRRAH
jgi:hypothetical protein